MYFFFIYKWILQLFVSWLVEWYNYKLFYREIKRGKFYFVMIIIFSHKQQNLEELWESVNWIALGGFIWRGPCGTCIYMYHYIYIYAVLNLKKNSLKLQIKITCTFSYRPEC